MKSKTIPIPERKPVSNETPFEFETVTYIDTPNHNSESTNEYGSGTPPEQIDPDFLKQLLNASKTKQRVGTPPKSMNMEILSFLHPEKK